MASSSELLLAAVKSATEGEYTIERELGRGGMAAVFLARDMALERRVAIKVMLPDLVDVEGLADRFLVEARTAAHLDHPGIVTVYSVKQRNDLLFIVMKYIAGNTLEGVLRSGTAISVDVASTLVGQVAEALQFAHAEGVVHRDVKPSNILVDVRGRPVIADFGIAKVTSSVSVTATGALIGTPTYMSPEQCRGLPATTASDQYSLGIVAYEMLAGRTPFSGSLFELIHAHCDTDPEPLVNLCPEADPAVCAAVERMMAKNPKDRWPTLGEVVRVFSREASRGRDSARVRADIIEMAKTQTLASGKLRPMMSPPPETQRVTTPAPALVVTPAEPQIEVGASLQLRASEMSGASLVGITIEWRSEDPTIATVDAQGVVTGVGAGLTKVTAAGGSAIGRASVTVKEAAVNTLVVTPQNPDLDANEELQLVVTALDARGNVMPKQQVVWVSSDVAICAISQQGRAIGIAPGRVTVTAQLGAIAGTTAIRVRPPAIHRIVVDPGEFGLEVEEKRALKVMVLGPSDRALTGRAVQWRSSVPAVASVTQEGVVEGLTPGTAAIVATSESKEGIASVTVRAQPVAAVRIQPARLQLELGRSLQLQGLAEDRKGRTLSGRGIEWSSDDNRVAMVDASGKVHGAAVGRTTVSAVSGHATSSIEVVVIPRPVAQVKIASHAPTLRVGAYLSLEAVALDADGASLTGRAKEWTCNDPAIASVDANGVVHAKREGAVRITVICESARATTRLSMIPAPVAAPQERPTAPMPVIQTSPPAAKPQAVEGPQSLEPPKALEKPQAAERPRPAAAPSAATPARRSRAPLAAVGVLILAGGAYGAWKAMSPAPALTPASVEAPAPVAPESQLPPAQPPTGGGNVAETPATKAQTKQAAEPPPATKTTPAPQTKQQPPTTVANVPVATAAPASRPDTQAPGRRDAERGAAPTAAAAAPPPVPDPTPTRPDPAFTPPASAGRGAEAPVTTPAVTPTTSSFNRALLCENSAAAVNALTAQAGSDPARQLPALYAPRDRGLDGLNNLLKDASRLRATIRAVRNETVGEGCEWIMDVEFNYTNAFGQTRRRTVQMRAELEAAATAARVKRVFGATGY